MAIDYRPSGLHNVNRGILYIGEPGATEGSVKGWRRIGQYKDFNVAKSVEEIELTDVESGFSAVVDNAITKIDGTGSFTIMDHHAYNMMLFAMAASVTETAQAAGAGTPTTVTAQLGLYIPIDPDFAQANFTDVVVKDAAETVTYTVDVDYTIDLKNGMIMAIPGGAISDDEELHITGFNVTETTIEDLYAATQEQVERHLYFEGKQAKGKYWSLWTYANFKPNGDYNASGGTDFAGMPIQFKMLNRGYYENGLYRLQSIGAVS